MVQPVTSAEFHKWNTADAEDIEPLLDVVIEMNFSKLRTGTSYNLSVDDAEDLEHLKMLLSAFNPDTGYYYQGYRFLLTDKWEVLAVRVS